MWRCPLNQGTRQCGNAGDAPLNQGTRQWGDAGDTLLIRGTGAQEADGSNARPRLRPLKDGQPHAHTADPTGRAWAGWQLHCSGAQALGWS